MNALGPQSLGKGILVFFVTDGEKTKKGKRVNKTRIKESAGATIDRPTLNWGETVLRNSFRLSTRFFTYYCRLRL